MVDRMGVEGRCPNGLGRGKRECGIQSRQQNVCGQTPQHYMLAMDVLVPNVAAPAYATARWCIRYDGSDRVPRVLRI